MKRIICLLKVALTAAAMAFGQEIHFSLYNLAPLSLNPANTATKNGELSAGIIYRNQWRAVDKPYFTISAHADKKLVFKSFNLGTGLLLLNDRSGPAGLNVTMIYPSFSIQRKFGNHFLTLGVQPGLVFKGLQGATFPNQFDYTTGNYNTALPSGEINNIDNRIYFDLNTGITYVLSNGKKELKLGQALHHINMPNISMIDGDRYQLKIRYSTHISYQQWLGRRIYIMPSLLNMYQNQANEIVVDIHAGYKIINQENLQITARMGTGYRNNIRNADQEFILKNGDAMIISGGVTWNEFSLDLAYDFNISGLSEIGPIAGAFEIILNYLNPFTRKLEKVAVPCRRY